MCHEINRHRTFAVTTNLEMDGWDTGHARVSCIDQPQAIHALGCCLVALHIYDNDGVSDRHWLPGYGDIDWPVLITALRNVGYNGPFNQEVAAEWRTTPLAARVAKTRYLVELCKVMLTPEFCSQLWKPVAS